MLIGYHLLVTTYKYLFDKKEVLFGKIIVMKILTAVLLLNILLVSCKKDTDTASPNISIDLITGTYKGGTLTWEKWQKNSQTNYSSGNDFNVSFTATYSANRVKIDITTTAPITKKSFELPLTFKQEMQSPGLSAGQFMSAAYKFMDTAVTYTLEKEFEYSASMVKQLNIIDISGRFDYKYLTNPWSSLPTYERFSLTGTKQ